MRLEPPEFKRCCFCLPLRQGLIGWGYNKLVLDVLASIRCIIPLVWIFRHPMTHKLNSGGVIVTIIVVTCLLVDTVFSMILIVAGHKKNAKFLRVSFVYSVVWLVLILAFGALLSYVDMTLISRNSEIGGFTYSYLVFEMLAGEAIIFVLIFVQVYLALLTRSEAIKLRNQRLEMQFVNNAAEGEAICVFAVSEDNAAQELDCAQDRGDNIIHVVNLPTT